jgi:predicted nucleotidyltransferase
MNRDDALAILRQSEPARRARGDNRPGSDIDVIVEIDPTAHIGVYDYVALKEYIESLFAGRVDVVSRDPLKPYVRPAATADAVYAF